MQPFGEFIMRSRRNAGLLALVFALLPFFNWLSVIIMALVTLRRGAKEGLVILFCVLLPSIVWVLYTKNETILLNIVIGATAIWIMASVLHKTHNWSRVLILGAFIGSVIIVLLHNYIPDMNAWWQQKMLASLQKVGKEIPINSSAEFANIKQISVVATGLQASAILLIDLVWLVIARYWQSMLYNPGKLRPELHNIRLPRWTTFAVAMMFLFAWLSKLPMLIDMLPLWLLIFAVTGLSVIHSIVAARKMSWMWLVVLYAMLFFSLPYMIVALAMVAMSDSWFNVRRLYVTH